MNDLEINRTPSAFEAILSETNALGFNMVSEPRVGSFLAALAASKPAGRLLELGTGTGHGTAWLLAGMDATSMLDTVDTGQWNVRPGPAPSIVARSISRRGLQGLRPDQALCEHR